jgi:S-adenosyl methyltransferase
MSDSAAGSRPDADTEDLMAKIDTTVPVSARIWNYWMGGTDYFPVDKAAGDEYAAVFPGIFDLARTSRAFIIRTVTYLAAEAGIRQFLDIGTGLPSHDNTHEIVQRVAPESRVVYVDRDPMVIAHARALLASNPAGNTDYIDGDVNDPGSILSSAREKLDFSRPVAIMLMGMLGHVGNPAEDDDAYTRGIVAVLTAALPSGGYLALNEAVDNDQSANEALDGYNQTGAVPYRARHADQIVRFFDGLELVDPGIVQLQAWRPEPGQAGPPSVPALGGVGRKR